MDKNDILNYVTETPGNTNRAVLGSMLDSMGGGGGGSSEFNKATLTLSTNIDGNMEHLLISGGDGYAWGFLLTENGISLDDQYVSVDYEGSEFEYYIVENQYILVYDDHEDEEYTITGNCELASKDGVNYVKVFGDCTISVPGTR